MIPKNIRDESEIYDFIRSIRWKKGVYCPRCKSQHIRHISRKRDNFKYYCNTCSKHFNDLTSTIFANTNIPLYKWVMAIYLVSLGDSNQEIGKEIGIGKNTQYRVCRKIRNSLWNLPVQKLSSIIEADEAYQSGYQVFDKQVKAGVKETGQIRLSFRKLAKKNQVRMLGILINHLLV